MKKTMTIMTRVRTYSELRRFDTFEERYEYLRLGGGVGESTFGFDRYINQQFYRSTLWKQVRNQVIVRDNGCDLGILDYPINGSLLVHHINPMSVDDLIHHEEWVLNPEYLITTTHDTHNAIHYGDQSLLKKPFTPRQMGDTKLW
jgi:hypothetical protein